MSNFNSKRSRGRGRGEYYKNKYGGGRSAKQDQQNYQDTSLYFEENDLDDEMRHETLLQKLRGIDGSSYPAYRVIETSNKRPSWMFHRLDLQYSLFIGKVQSDPFAPPTRCRLIIPSHVMNLPQDLYLGTKLRAIATSDFLHRQVFKHLQQLEQRCASKSAVLICTPTQQYVLEQTAVFVTTNGDVVVQFMVHLPARGRTITSHDAIDIFDTILPSMASALVAFSNESLNFHVFCVEDQEQLRSQLPLHNLVAFIANGSILPRASGADDSPKIANDTITTSVNGATSNSATATGAAEVVIPFHSPLTHEISFHLKNLNQTITGMGIPRGITVVVGGGYHGKSTLLQALQVSCYNKIPGDGREFVVCLEETVKIRAEDKRSISCVDISPFIDSQHLPFPNINNTTRFSTKEASGSTSQAANIMEAIELGAKTFLIDELLRVQKCYDAGKRNRCWLWVY